MIVDLHIHTNRSSYCSSLSPDEMFDRVETLGLDAVAVTEHSTHHGAQIAYEMGKELCFTVFRGVEVYTTSGDMLVFGTEAEVMPDMEFSELLEIVRRDGGIIISAHPTRGYWGHHRKYKGHPPREVLEQVDAIEALNGGCSYQANVMATRLASELGLPQVGGSDAHIASQVGKCVTVLQDDVWNEEELIQALRAGKCRAAYLEDVISIADGKTIGC
ncbi:MAG: PHP domain-containing protein [Actinomycetota bacterium]|nr:PHP domain-containing protein [Actinomycetota bacterium]